MAAAEILCSVPIFEVGVVGDDFKGFWKAFKEVSPAFEGFDDGKHFLVIDFVVVFGRLHG
jgi:hypothetical protein